MPRLQEKSIYKSPERKLVRFFETSRNKWKTKARESKRMLKRLKNRIRFLEASRARWKDKAKRLEVELAQMKAREQAREAELTVLKKKPSDEISRLEYAEEFTYAPARQQYSLGHITLFLDFILSAATSLRGAGRAMALAMAVVSPPLASPSWSTGRLWLLRLGYYKLTRPLPHAPDWVWIVDHTAQMGAAKCLVILGVRLSSLSTDDYCLRHEQVEPLALFPVTQSDGEVVFQQLEQTLARTGVPRAIVSDAGSELHAGVSRFCRIHPETASISDIKHQTALLLKHDLQSDATWDTFCQLATRTRHQVQQTPLAALAPPNQRTKSRYMNVDRLVVWGERLLAFLDRQMPLSAEAFDPSQIEAKYGWLRAFRQPLRQWGELLSIATATEDFVRTHGLYRRCHMDLEPQLAGLAQTARSKRMRQKLLGFVRAESFKARAHERLVGSSEVLESVLGRFKQLEHEQAKSGFTGLLLSLAALVSTTTPEVIQTALERVRTKQVVAWCKNTLGKSVQARRWETLIAPQKSEQKQNQMGKVA
jgi:hypothetical protein